MTHSNTLRLRRLGIDSYLENIVYMSENCHICKSEGFKALTRVEISCNEHKIIATLNVIQSNLLGEEEASLSQIAFQRLAAKEGDVIQISHLEPLNSMSYVRSKIYGNKLGPDAYLSIITDITRGRYSEVQLAAFLSACSGTGRMDVEEIISLTNAMIISGERITWVNELVVDKHSIGGLPGNRTTPIVVAIVAAAGLIIPKTSSRAITSPAGTADTMEVITNVNLSTKEIKELVKKEGGCLAWGGAVKLSPADDIIIRVERALDIDSEGQLISSVLSKKVSVGSKLVVIDIPIGPTAKVRTWEAGESLKLLFEKVAEAIGLTVKVLLSDGSQPVGFGIGPSLEAMDVLSVLRNSPEAPTDLRERALILAGAILDSSGRNVDGVKEARRILDSGVAYDKFKAICEGQGRFTEPEYAPFKREVLAGRKGVVVSVNNRKLAMVAKLAGAPTDKAAGVRYHVRLGEKVSPGDILYSVYAESQGELEYAIRYSEQHDDIIEIANGD